MQSVSSESGMFSLLPRRRTPWYDFVFSYGVQAIAIAILVWIPVLHPEILERPKPDYHAIELVPTPVPVNHEPQRQLPRPVLTARLDPPTAALRLPAPQPRPRPVDEDTRAPEVKIAEKKVDIPAVASPIPKQIVRTNLFSTGSSAPQTIDKAPQQVQTGGFGDPKGVPARTTQTRAVNIASAGGFDMPVGPGNGNGTGGSNGARGVVASTGFGGGVATQDTHTTARSTVQQAGFGDANAAPANVPSRVVAVAPKITPAEILSKPVPVYTEEARTKRIEGEVLLEVVLEASGKVQVLRVVRGLGHGLDEAAVRAAEQIRFKPALKDGQPADSSAVLHIIFQLA
jgi:TonB family protein